MAEQTFNAVFENGYFRLLNPLDISIPEGQKVQINLEITQGSNDKLSPTEILKLATSVYKGLSEQQIEEIEQIAFGNQTK